MIPSTSKARFLMCRPEHFGVTYAINPWMDPSSWARDDRSLVTAARREWAALSRTLRNRGAAIELVPPVEGLPDLVFTANAAVVLDRTALLARFRYPERQPESAHFEAAFLGLQAHGLIDTVRKLPDDLMLEGAGDCVWDETRSVFWMGYGPRSDAAARDVVEAVFGADVIALELADPCFYHLDTAFCPLSRGEVLIVPGAFTPAGKAAIRERIPSPEQIEVGIEDASELAANAVCLRDTIVMSHCGERLRRELAERGYTVVTTALTAFLRSGGAAFCLTLRLDRRSVVEIAVDDVAVA
jgi:N-dimethylarginine dimethylaminohydrolase